MNVQNGENHSPRSGFNYEKYTNAVGNDVRKNMNQKPYPHVCILQNTPKNCCMCIEYMECQEHSDLFWLPESATADSAVSVYRSSSVLCSTSSTYTTCIYMYIVHVIFVIKRYRIYVVCVCIYMYMYTCSYTDHYRYTNILCCRNQPEPHPGEAALLLARHQLGQTQPMDCTRPIWEKIACSNIYVKVHVYSTPK